MTRMTSLTGILLVSIVCNLVLIVKLNRNGQDDIMLIGRQFMTFAGQNIGMAHPTLAHALTNYYVSQFDHWNQVTADT